MTKDITPSMICGYEVMENNLVKNLQLPTTVIKTINSLNKKIIKLKGGIKKSNGNKK